MRIALVEEHGFADPIASSSCARKHARWSASRGKVTEVVEPALACGDDQRLGEQPPEIVDLRVGELAGMVRVDASGCTEQGRGGGCEFDCAARAVERAARDQGMPHTSCHGRGDDLVPIRVEAVMREVEPDVDEHRGIMASREVHAARRASVTGSLAARSAGNSPPTRPMPSAHLSPFQSSSGETLNWNMTWLKFEPSVDTL